MTSIVLYLYDIPKIKVLEDQYVINYQYYDGDYAWVMIVDSEKVNTVSKKFKNNLTVTKSSGEKILRLTRKRDQKYALEFGYILDQFDSQLEDYLQNKHMKNYDYLLSKNFLSEEQKALYNKDADNYPETQPLDDSILRNIVTDDNCEKCIGDNLYCMQGDCNEKLKLVTNKSIQTICIDPPYNIGKDTWDNIDNYNEWLTTIVVTLESKLRDNGSLFIFHNDMEAISELMVSIKKKTKLKFIQMITWNKRYEGSKKKGFLDGYVVKKGAHKWELMAEYILFYTFDNTYKYKEARLKNKVCAKDIQKEVLSKTGGLTGWYTNIETGLNHPTRERMKPITKHIGLKYEDVVPKFINQKKHHSVWNYDSAKKNKNCSHLTPKPVDLLENIIKHTTDEGDIVLDCFAGTGSMGQACLNTKRRCILIEKDADYYSFIKSELF